MISSILLVTYLGMSTVGMIDPRIIELKSQNEMLIAQLNCAEEESNNYKNLLQEWSINELIAHKNAITNRITILPYVKRKEIHQTFLKKLQTYSGPTMIVTSMTREDNLHSNHHDGNAIDLRLDHEVVSYLCSREGKEWMREHSLRLLIEGNSNDKRSLSRYTKSRKYRKFVMLNPKASGKHLHLAYKPKFE